MTASSFEDRRWTIRLASARAREILRDEGISVLWKKLLGETVYRKLILFQRTVEGSLPDLHARVPIIVQLLEKPEVAEYVGFRGETPLQEVERRLDTGHRCFVARLERRFVAASWVAVDHAWSSYLSCEIPVAAGEFYVYDSFTLPDFRGMGIAPAISAHVMRYFRETGYRRGLRAIQSTNRSSLRAVAKAGFVPCGQVGFVRLGPWRRYFHRMNGGNRPA